MSLSAERVAIANRAIASTFEQTSIAWQAIPHWDIGDPGQVKVRSDTTLTFAGMAPPSSTVPTIPPLPPGPVGGGTVPIAFEAVEFQISFAQASAPTPDALLAAVIPRAAELAAQLDGTVFPALCDPASKLAAGARADAWFPKLAAPVPPPTPPNADVLLAALIGGREVLEDSGYRASSCMVAGTSYYINLAQWVGSNVATEGLLVGANANSLFRATALNGVVLGGGAAGDFMIMIGRRQEIAHGEAASASAGEEGVDIAVSVAPSLEVVGDNASGTVDLAVRIRYALRIKDERAVVVFRTG